MPTGYTAGIIDGSIKTFEQYAKTCVRAFGAAIHMRDDSLSEEYVPREPGDYHLNALNRAKKQLNQSKKMTDTKIIKDRNKAHIISNILNNITFHHKDISIGFKCEELEKEEQKEFKEFVVNEERWKQVNAILKRLKDFEEASRKSIINIK